MSTEKLSQKQQEILDFLKGFYEEKGYPPSVREICQGVDLHSTSSVHAHLSTLEKKGYIRRNNAEARAMEILSEEKEDVIVQETVPLPVVGQIAAGEPILAEQNIETYFSLPAEFLPKTSQHIFVLKVKGDSMINVGIYPGDFLVCEKAENANNGEIVVALIDDSATVKRFYKENGHYRLQPENDSMDPIIVDKVEVIGKVRSLFRQTVN